MDVHGVVDHVGLAEEIDLRLESDHPGRVVSPAETPEGGKPDGGPDGEQSSMSGRTPP